MVGISVYLIILVLASFVIWIIIENQSISRLEPSNLYFFKPPYSSDNETYMNVWNSSKNLEEISNLSKLGNYSVLITWNAYRWGWFGYTEWFVVASTLKPDKNGFIYQVSLRLNFENLTLVASYEQTLSYNLTSFENGTKTIEDYISQLSLDFPYQAENDLHNYYPFLILFHIPTDFGGMVILNQETGKIMIAANCVWLGAGGLLYPENIPKLGDLSFP